MKTINFQYMPEETGGGQGDGKKKPVRTKTIPQADIDFKDVSQSVAAAWLANPDITLRWKKAADFEKETIDYADSLQIRVETGNLRPGQTLTLNQLDDRIEEGVSDVKTYIEKKYKKANAPAQFARFGITHSKAGYFLGRDRNNRNEALKLMVKSIAAEGFGNEEFGTAFWTDIQKAYETALVAASNTAGDVSKKVATKNQQKKNITVVLNSLLKVLQGNYPDQDEYKGVIRQWGWKKESY